MIPDCDCWKKVNNTYHLKEKESGGIYALVRWVVELFKVCPICGKRGKPAKEVRTDGQN